MNSFLIPQTPMNRARWTIMAPWRWVLACLRVSRQMPYDPWQRLAVWQKASRRMRKKLRDKIEKARREECAAAKSHLRFMEEQYRRANREQRDAVVGELTQLLKSYYRLQVFHEPMVMADYLAVFSARIELEPMLFRDFSYDRVIGGPQLTERSLKMVAELVADQVYKGIIEADWKALFQAHPEWINEKPPHFVWPDRYREQMDLKWQQDFQRQMYNRAVTGMHVDASWLAASGLTSVMHSAQRLGGLFPGGSLA